MCASPKVCDQRRGHISQWDYIIVVGVTPSRWNLDISGRLEEQPRSRRREFAVAADGISRPVESRTQGASFGFLRTSLVKKVTVYVDSNS